MTSLTSNQKKHTLILNNKKNKKLKNQQKKDNTNEFSIQEQQNIINYIRSVKGNGQG